MVFLVTKCTVFKNTLNSIKAPSSYTDAETKWCPVLQLENELSYAAALDPVLPDALHIHDCHPKLSLQ